VSFSYKITGESYNNILDGKYKANLYQIDNKIDNYGGYIWICWKLYDCNDKMHSEKFYVDHGDPIKREKAILAFEKFIKQMTGKDKGDIVVDSDLVGRDAFIVIKNNVAENGNVYVNVVNRIPIINDIDQHLSAQSAPVNAAFDEAMAQYGVIPKIGTGMQVSGDNLNDEVPF
jgi:hypothetical protein